MLKIEIKTGGAAFSEDEVLTIEGRYEVARLLRNVAMKIENFHESGKIMGQKQIFGHGTISEHADANSPH